MTRNPIIHYDRMSLPQNPVVCVVHYEDGRTLECASWRGAELRVEADYPGTTTSRRGAAVECLYDGRRVATIRAYKVPR